MTATTERTIARTDLMRTASFTLRAADEADQDDDGFTIDGYATVYGRDLKANEEPTSEAGWAEIDSWEGRFFERFQQGAFRKSIREKLPRMQFDHGRHPLLGSLPLGTWRSVTEENEGLHTVGRLSDNWLIEPFRLAMTGPDPAVDGMSIRFEVVREEWRNVDGKVVPIDQVLYQLWEPPEAGPLRRTIKEAKLPEAGPVVWPAYQATSVGVRSSVTIDLGRLHEPGQRIALAQAVAAADAAEAQRADDEEDEEPPTTDPAAQPGTGSAGEHSDDDPDSTTPDAVGVGSTDTPQATEQPEGRSAGEHESPTTDPIQDGVDRVRAEARDSEYREALSEMRTALELTVYEEKP